MGKIGNGVLCILIMGGICFIDLVSPLEVIVNSLYILAILASLWSASKLTTYFVTFVSLTLTVGVYILQSVSHSTFIVKANYLISIVVIIITAAISIRYKDSAQRHEAAVVERNKALEQLKVLQGILPICAHCKKIRNGEGSWVQMEYYISNHSEAKFSHGLCEECAKEYFPGYIRS